jgi:hypothetical protein
VYKIITRKRFLSIVAMGGTGAFLALQKNSQAQTRSLPPGAPSAPPKPPPLDKELVKDFVIKGHSDLAGTKALLEKESGLLNSCWDWVVAISKPLSKAPDTWGTKTLPIFC